MPGISHLKAFLEAVTCGSFAEASANLSLSESAVSARIKTLESALGQRLFHRSKHGVILNETGKAFMPFAETAVGAWQQGKETVDAASQGNVRVAIGIQQDIWEVFAAEWFAAIKQIQPDIHLSVICDYTDILCQRLVQDLLDVAIVFRPKRTRGIVLEPLTQVSLVLVSNNEVEWSGALPDDYCYVNWGQEFADWHGEVFGNPQSISLSVSVSGMALSALKKNGGAAYLMKKSVAQLVDTGDLFVIDQAPKFDIDVWIARSESSPRAEIVEPLMGINLLRNLMSSGS